MSSQNSRTRNPISQANGELQPPSMSTSLEFLLVSDHGTLNAVSAGIKRLGQAYPRADSGGCPGLPEPTQIDAMFVDLEVPGAFCLIESIRKGSSDHRCRQSWVKAYIGLFRAGGSLSIADQHFRA